MRAPKNEITAADLFCGGGGRSEGLLMAANELEANLTLIAVNHWNVAIDTHRTNHPYAKHLYTGMDNVEPFMVTVNLGEGETPRAAQSVDKPMGIATTKIGTGICEPFLIAYYGTQNMSEIDEPLPTVTRFGLVEPAVTKYRLDIRFRMLPPRELARAQGFPDSYKFTGNRANLVKQVGNAVPPNTAKALLMEVLA